MGANASQLEKDIGSELFPANEHFFGLVRLRVPPLCWGLHILYSTLDVKPPFILKFRTSKFVWSAFALLNPYCI
jgi:hypothetical protein